MNLEINLPKAYNFLFQPARYKVAYGGRGAARSWSYVRALIVTALQKKTRIVCFREIQNSIKESIHRLISDQITLMGLDKYFVITDRQILCNNGSEFIFEGLYRNVNRIKSLEGVDVADIEEAESVSEDSWQILLPTIRKPNSEIWIRFNTKYVDDATYSRFVVNTPENAIVRKTSYKDNPYFPDVLMQEMKADRAFRPLEAKNIWDGEPIGTGRKVWQEFNPTVHVREFKWKDIITTANCFMAIDPAQHYYPACLWIAMFPKNNRRKGPEDFIKWVYNEWPKKDDLGAYFHEVRQKLLYSGSLADLSMQIYANDMTIQEQVKIEKRGIDTRFAKGSGAGNYYNDTTGIVGQWAKKENGGLLFSMPDEKIIDIQRDTITKDMQYNTLLPLGQNNEPSLYIAPWCHNLLQSMSNHRLEEDAEKESPKYKDFSDTLRILYATMAGHTWRDPMPHKEPELVRYAGDYHDNAQGWMS